MRNHEDMVVDFVHQADAMLSINRRIDLYRSLAATTSSEALAKHFFECADDLAAAEEKIGQLKFHFKRRSL